MKVQAHSQIRMVWVVSDKERVYSALMAAMLLALIINAAALFWMVRNQQRLVSSTFDDLTR